jgi:peptidoglycan-associated lipoprotein
MSDLMPDMRTKSSFDWGPMRNVLLVVLTTVMAVCSTASPLVTAAAGDSAGRDLSGRWIGTWTGTGLLMSPREDAVTLHLVQRGDLAYGRFALEGATAAESVPIDIRNAGLWGIRVRAKVSGEKVTLRHDAGGHLFTADLKVSDDGEYLYGTVRGRHPKVKLVLTRASEGGATPPQTAMVTPAPAAPVTEPPPAADPGPKVVVMGPPEPKEAAPPREADFVSVPELAPIHFDFDKADLRKDAVDTLTAHVAWLKDHADAVVLIEGHCDERGTDEYNVALGERRAKSVSDLLAAQGIPRERITTTSFGRERPVCTGSTEECRMKNRRAEFRVKTR